MIRELKAGKTEVAREEDDTRVRHTVEGIIADIKSRSDAAVRELSVKFDKWSPASFRLSPAEIEKIVASVPTRTIDDIKFAQTQIRRFAQVQRDSMHDVEVETIPGVTLGHKNIPVDSVG